jgi:polyhydroxyalkanoate synthesis regulator phasin
MSFKKGKSGNPAGRPKGIADKRTALRALLVPHAEKLIDMAVSLALAGDTAALRICIDRLIPPIKAKDAAVAMPGLKGGLSEQGQEVLSELAAGRLTPDEASTVMQTVAAQARIVEVDELVKRVRALEDQSAAKSE